MYATQGRRGVKMLPKIGWRAILALLVLGVAVPPARSQTEPQIKLYVTNSLGDDITVIDLKALKVVGDIKVGKRVHGVAAQADGRRLFTTIESEHNLKVIDTAEDKVIDTIPLTGMPNQCAVTPNGRFVGVPIRDGNGVDIVDMTRNRVVKTLPVRVPHNCFNAGSNEHMFVTSMGGDSVNLIDLKTLSYVDEIPVTGIPRPIAVSQDEKTMYVALSDFHGFVIVDVPGRKVIQTVELPPAPHNTNPLEPHTETHGLALSPDGRELWVTSLGATEFTSSTSRRKGS
jgi:YVTN family beta-propeller protein